MSEFRIASLGSVSVVIFDPEGHLGRTCPTWCRLTGLEIAQ
jgi:hypothetical protein